MQRFWFILGCWILTCGSVCAQSVLPSAAKGKSVAARSKSPPSVLRTVPSQNLAKSAQHMEEYSDEDEASPDEELSHGPSILEPPPPQGKLHWSSPYQMSTGPRVSKFDHGWRRRLPTGMIPFWGPRTKIAERSRGWGQPLGGASWLNRPNSASVFMGTIDGQNLTNTIRQDASFFGGYRLGWDYDYYFGAEARFGLATVRISDAQRITTGSTADYITSDLDFLYYPWGDSRWRPFFLLGLGFSHFAFIDDHNQGVHSLVFEVPFGVGLKYRASEWLVYRAEILDNATFAGDNLNSMQNLSFTAGVEIRFGGVRPSYYPWHPSRTIW